MRRLLDINNPIMRFLTAMFDLMALSVLWVVFSLPIFTMGAASTALWNSFFSAFKENFKRSTLTWLVALAILGFLGADALLLRSLILQGYSFGWFYGVTLALVVLALTWTVYLAAYAARFNGTVKEVLRYSFMLLRAHPVKMLCVMVLVMGGMALALTLPATVVFIPATVYWGATFPIEWTFLKHMRPEDKARMEKEKFE